MTLYARNNIWGLKRRVPVRYTTVEPRKVVWVSLKTDSITIARTKAEIVWQALLDAWEARLLGQDESAAKRYAAAMDLAQQRGFQFLPAHEVAQLPTADLVARLQAVMREPETAREIEAQAVLGGAKEVYPKLSEALESYWSLAAADVRRKSDDQRRRWENPRKKAIKNLIDVIGDKRLDQIIRVARIDPGDRLFHPHESVQPMGGFILIHQMEITQNHEFQHLLFLCMLGFDIFMFRSPNLGAAEILRKFFHIKRSEQREQFGLQLHRT